MGGRYRQVLLYITATKKATLFRTYGLYKTGDCLTQAESYAESSYRSFLHYFQSAFSNHLHLYQFIPV